jgi:NADH-quinone oxidoreductase subunit G
VLRGADDVVVIWGERAWAAERGRETAEALLEVAARLGVAERSESGLIGIPESANGRGLREVGCLPGLAPGLTAAEEPEELEQAGALLLVDANLDAGSLEQADTVIAFARFRDEALDEHANVVFPAEIYAEKGGTLTHPDGRIQRLRQALGHADAVRPGWHVLGQLCERVGAGPAPASLPELTAEVAAAVPFYAGLTLEEVGGRGVRWQDRDAASALQADEPDAGPLPEPPAAPEGSLVAVARTLWQGPEVVHSRALSFLAPTPQADISPEDARALGVETGAELEVAVNGSSVVATARVRTGVPAGSVFVSPPGTLPEGAVRLAAAGVGVAS